MIQSHSTSDEIFGNQDFSKQSFPLWNSTVYTWLLKMMEENALEVLKIFHILTNNKVWLSKQLSVCFGGRRLRAVNYTGPQIFITRFLIWWLNLDGLVVFKLLHNSYQLKKILSIIIFWGTSVYFSFRYLSSLENKVRVPVLTVSKLKTLR